MAVRKEIESVTAYAYRPAMACNARENGNDFKNQKNTDKQVNEAEYNPFAALALGCH